MGSSTQWGQVQQSYTDLAVTKLSLCTIVGPDPGVAYFFRIFSTDAGRSRNASGMPEPSSGRR
jgi:hypothetical protein